ncbi:hypothetical protein ACFZC6_04260 [Streptomyces ossamyceticus]|uniref:hypothetical protein n=1 Tax=Streptomyces ossamyceticus TaxID=249581 RepID=UPI0036E0A232
MAHSRRGGQPRRSAGRARDLRERPRPGAAIPAYAATTGSRRRGGFLWLSGDQHIHTQHSSDGKYRVVDQVRQGARHDLDWLVITGHGNATHAKIGASGSPRTSAGPGRVRGHPRAGLPPRELSTRRDRRPPNHHDPGALGAGALGPGARPQYQTENVASALPVAVEIGSMRSP